MPGWTDEYGWEGMIPFDELPYTFNPKEGYIVTANNQVTTRDYPYFITADWSDYGSRADPIVKLINAQARKIDITYIQNARGRPTMKMARPCTAAFGGGTSHSAILIRRWISC